MDPLDRSAQHKDASPDKLLNQLNENWRQLRLLSLAIADRDRAIDSLHKSVAERDKAISRLNSRLRFAKVRVALLYALVGGIAAKGAEELIVALVKLFAAFWGHY